jgi:hypothetical protein
VLAFAVHAKKTNYVILILEYVNQFAKKNAKKDTNAMLKVDNANQIVDNVVLMQIVI